MEYFSPLCYYGPCVLPKTFFKDLIAIKSLHVYGCYNLFYWNSIYIWNNKNVVKELLFYVGISWIRIQNVVLIVNMMFKMLSSL